MRFLSIHLPFLSTDRVRRREGTCFDASPEPLALWSKVNGAHLLTASDPAARARNLHPGMPVTVARSMCPDLRLLEADAEADTILLSAITDWCRRFTPLAALDAPDGIILDVSGVAHLFGGDDGLLGTVAQAIAAQGFAHRLSLAPTSAAAAAFARWNGPRVTPDAASLEKAVRTLPLVALRLDDRAIGRMKDAGLRRLGDLILRPRAPITARFGPAVFARIDGMLGTRRDPLSPRFESPPYMTERRYAEGLARRDDISATLRDLCDDLCAMLSRNEEGARKIGASFFRVDGIVRHIDVATSRPSRDPRSLGRLLDERLDAIGEEGLDTGYGFDVIRLAALSVETLPGEQRAMGHAGDSSGASEKDFTDLVDKLGARLGTSRVQRLDFIATHWPERAVTARPAARGRPDTSALARLPSDETRSDAPLLPARPMRLFERPEQIDNVVFGTPDGPPMRFRWRRVTHDVIAFEGPERIAPEWWKDTGPTRDYFRVEDSGGGRFWLYREGLFATETAHPRWFVHGLFG